MVEIAFFERMLYNNIKYAKTRKKFREDAL